MPFVLPSLSTSTTGNARGVGAVDLQTDRTSASNVASGTNSAVLGGKDNFASATATVVCGGKSNYCSNTYSFVGGGKSNYVQTSYGTISGGLGNLVDNRATVPGGSYASAKLWGQFGYASGRFAVTGDAQMSMFMMRNTTSDATQTELFLDGSSRRLALPSSNNVVWSFWIQIVAKRTDANNESAAYEIKGCIDKYSNATALVGSITKTVIAEDNAAWDVTAEADDTNDALVIKVTGEAAKTVQWVATVILTQTF